MNPTFTTDGAADFLSEVHETDGRYVEFAVRKGQNWLKMAGVSSASHDLALLAYHCWRGMGDLLHSGVNLDHDYEVAGDVLDAWVTDHDAELLVEVVPEIRAESPVGGMTPEVTGVHSVLLTVVGTMRERWQDED